MDGNLRVKRILSFLSGLALALFGPFARMPAWAQLLTLGVGGVVTAAVLTPPTLLPQLSAAFDSNIPNGLSNNGLKINGGGAAGSMEYPTTQTNSVFYTFEGSVDALTGTGASNQETPLGDALVLAAANAGPPTFFMQTQAIGTAFKWWGGLTGISPVTTLPSLGAVGSGYNPGIYPWTASGGGCAREPAGVWAPYNGTISFTDPGFGCNAAPTIAPASIPGVGAQQATGASGATACVSNSPVAGEMTVTASVAVAHGITPGQTGLTLAGFTPSGFNASNYAALAGTAGTTLVLETTTGGGTCPASTASVEGTALVGTGATITIPAFSTTNPIGTNYSTGITVKSNDKFCAVVGEYGADSATPGVQFMHMVDPNGNAFPGAPAAPPILNQGALNFTGYILNGAQDTNFTFVASFGTSGVASTTMTVTGTPGGTLAVGQTITGASIAPGTTIASLGTGSGGAGTYILSTSNILPSQTNTAHTYAPALTVTAMASYSISAASWASGTFGNGQVTLTTTAAHPFIPGSVLQFSGFTGNWAALNGLQFIAQSGTTGSTIVAGLYTGGASSIALANPGGYSASAGAVAGTIEPNMYIPGVSGVVFISPYGTFGSSGTGGVGTYGLTSNSEGGFSITGGITGTALAITTIPSVGNYEWVAAGSGLATTGGVSSGTIIESQSSGTAGGIGSYVVNNSQTISSGTAMATNGNVWSSAAPGNLYAANQYYNVVSPGYAAGSNGGTLTAKGAGNFGDFFSYIGTKNSALGQTGAAPWGGALANVGDHWGVFPQDANGNPSTASLASLCEKTTDYRAFDVANSITTESLYRLNDPGEWGDSSNATITGYLSGATGTSGGAATLNVSSTIFGSLALSTGTQTAFLAAPGLPPSPTPASVNPASIPLTTSASSTYTVTFPTGVTSINLGSSGSPVQISVGKWKPAVPLGNALINGYITTSGGSGVCAANPCLTVTGFQTSALYSAFTGTYNPAATANNLTVSGVTGALAAGQLITDGGVSITGPPLLITAGSGTTWTVTGAYYPNTITADSTMIGTLSTVNPNMTITSGVNTPVQIVGYGSGSGGLGTYQLSNSANGAVGSSGSPAVFTLASITGGGAIAPGPALTISDPGAGTMYAVTNFPSASPTGAINLKGTYSAGSLGGTPSSIQAQLSSVPGGPAVAGFSWVPLSSQSIAGGNWSGSIANVPPGTYWVSVRAANGTSYATMRNFVTVAYVFDGAGEGSFGAFYGGGSSGALNTTITGGPFSVDAAFGGSPIVTGPAFGKYRPNFSQALPANRFSQESAGLMSEGMTDLAQVFYNAIGVGVGQIDAVINGTGSLISTIGGQKQNETVGIGDGSSVTWCSAAIYCANHGGGALAFNAAGLTGASITGYVTTTGGVSTLTVSSMVAGAIEPGLTLSGSGVTGSPTLTACTATCPYTTGGAGAGSTWTLSSNQGTIGSSGSPVALNVALAGGAAWPNSNVIAGGFPMVGGGVNYGQQVVQMGTFSLSVNGTQVCADNASFAYNVYGGACTGAGIASSFISYTTGAYEVTFSSPPANGAIIQATWTVLSSRDATNGAEQVDTFGNGTATSGFWSALFEKYPGGASTHVYSGCNSEWGEFNLTGGYAVNAIGFSQRISWFYGTKLPSIIPGQAAAAPFVSLGFWNSQGSSLFSSSAPAPFSGLMGCDQWFKDVATPSTFTGTVTGGGTSSPVLTLLSSVTGALWEGEVLGCNPYSTACSGMGGVTPSITLGTQITGILSGTWGASGSTYSLTAPGGAANVVNVASQPMINEVYYSGPGPAVYAGGEHDTINQIGSAASLGGIAGHLAAGWAGGRRVGVRAGIEMAAALSANPGLASPPTLLRAVDPNCDPAALASPCFVVGSAYSTTATTTSISGSVLTFNGLSANTLPIVDGQAVSCSACNAGLYVVSVSNPPTQSTVAGAGQIGSANNGMTVTLNAAPGVSGAVAFTFGCKGTSGTGSNCIIVDFSINTTGAYGTTASLATCGANTLQGFPGTYSITGYIAGTTFTVTSAPSGKVGVNTSFYGAGVSLNTYVTALGTGLGSTGTYTVTPSQTLGSSGSPVTMTAVAYTVPQGPCNDNGVGEIVRNFRIGTTQTMGAGVAATGDVYDDGLDPIAGNWNQSAAFTANIVAPTVVRIVKGPTYSGGVPSSIGEWLSTGTFVSYGDQEGGNSRVGGLLGNVGGQSLAFTAGSGGTNGTVTVTGTSCGLSGANSPPKVDVTVSGGAIVDVYPSASSTNSGIGITSPCAFTTGVTGGTVTTLAYGPNEGQAGYASVATQNNMMGDTLYDNSGEPGNPLFSVFANRAAGSTSYFEPGLPVKTWGQDMGARVSG